MFVASGLNQVEIDNCKVIIDKLNEIWNDKPGWTRKLRIKILKFINKQVIKFYLTGHMDE